MKTLRVVHTIASTRASHGGTSRSVPDLCEALAATGLEVALVTRANPDEVETGGALLPSAPVQTELVPEPIGVRGRLKGARTFKHTVAQRARGENLAVIHDHGAWLDTNRAASRAAEETGAILVVSPRGMLTRWSLSHNRFRKRVAWVLFQRRILERAGLIHATSEAEAEELGDLDLDRPVAVIPNAIDPPEGEPGPRGGDEAERTALFLSRFHPKKGLPNLVEAWARVRPTGWSLLLVGPSEGGHRAEVERLAGEFGVASSVRFRGPVSDEEKWDLYRSADLFILPSHSENFGIVVGEALAAEVPVIATKATPWKELEEHDCGWWVDVGVDPLVRAIEGATGTSVERRAEMGRRGRDLVRKRYGRGVVAKRMRETYEWLAGGGAPPEWVTMP